MVGKTCMILCFIKDEFPENAPPTVFDNYNYHLNYNGKEIELDIWDTAGQDDQSRMRPLAYTNNNCFIVCFSLVDRQSLKHVSSIWL